MQLLFTNYNKNNIKNINKRSTSKERHIKTLIVADKSMKDHYDYIDLDAYLKTIVNIVNALFYDPSIGNLINIEDLEISFNKLTEATSLKWFYNLTNLNLKNNLKINYL